MTTIDHKAPADSKATLQDAGTHDFIQTHDVTKVKRKAIPGAGEEAADLSQDDGKDDSSDDPTQTA